MKKIFECQEKFLPTTDEWYPNFERNTVKCSLLQLRTGQYRVCVWGADDDGMEKDMDSRMDAIDLWKRLPNPITKDWLKSEGFIRA